MARFVATVRLFEQDQLSVWGLETSTSDDSSIWNVRDEAAANIMTLFPNTEFGSLIPSDIRRRVFEELNRRSPDVVAINSYSLPDARASLEWCLTNGKPAIIMTDSRAEDTRRSRPKEWLKSKIVCGFNAALVSGSQSTEYIAQLGISTNNIFTPYDVVDNNHFSTRPDESGSQWEKLKPFFLASTRDIPRKNISGLVEAYQNYRQASPQPWNLVILGAESPTGLENLPGVHFAGAVTYDQLPDVYHSAEVFVHAAHSDQWGLVVNEALASGLPILVSRGTGCAPELVVDGVNGFSFATSEKEDLLLKLSQISSDQVDRKAMGYHSKKVVKKYTPSSFATAMHEAVEAANEGDSNRAGALRILRVLNVVARKINSFHSVER